MTARACAGLYRTLRRLACCLALLGYWARGASAQAAPESYETKRLELFLQSAQLAPDPNPEGKLIDYIRIERREVFEPNDLAVPLILPSFASTWPNAFHWLTTEKRIRSELLLHEGARYSDQLAEETMRNLRRLSSLLAMARIVAVQTKDPSHVGLVVYTRDLWSLRFEQSFAGAGSTFAANAQLVERNLFGRGQALTVRGSLDPNRFSVGQTFEDYRFFGQSLSVYESFDVIMNRRTTSPEGSTGMLLLERPFYNLAQRSAFHLYGAFSNYVFRDTRAGQVVGYSIDPAGEGLTCKLSQDNCLARVWREKRLSFEASGDYRIGEHYKATFSFGVGVSDRRVGDIAETALTPEQSGCI